METMKATLKQIAWYIERDGGQIVRHDANGDQLVRIPLHRGGAGHIDYLVPAMSTAELNEERDRVYAQLRRKAREAAAR